MDYETLLTEARPMLCESITADLSGDFNWEQLINLILEEDSPLQELFSEKTLQLADTCQAADRFFQSAEHLNDTKEEDTKGDS
jgi:hypothetical protein